MAKIRDLALTDILQINKLLAFVDAGAHSFFDSIILPRPFNMLYNIFPVCFKFLPESYVLKDKNDIFACITVRKFHGNHRKWQISKLLMTDTQNDAGILLIQYAVTKLAAKGVHTFMAVIEENQTELIQLFIDGAGFRHCSRQQMWRCTDYTVKNLPSGGLSIRPFKNSDAYSVSELFNESVLPHFRPSLRKNKGEFHESLLSGLMPAVQFRYIIENRENKQLVSYLLLKTSDNKNFILDCVISKGYEDSFDIILNYALKLAQKRTQNPTFYVVNKYYMQTAQHIESVLKNNGYEPSNSYGVLVKDLFKTVKSENNAPHNVFYTDINSNPAFKIQNY